MAAVVLQTPSTMPRRKCVRLTERSVAPTRLRVPDWHMAATPQSASCSWHGAASFIHSVLHCFSLPWVIFVHAISSVVMYLCLPRDADAEVGPEIFKRMGLHM